MLKRILLISSLFLTCSCISYVDNLRGEDDRGMLYVQALAGMRDTTVIMVRPTFPLGGDYGDLLSVRKAEVKLAINGQPARIRKAYEENTSLNECTVFTPDSVRPGDRLELSVSSPGLESVTAVTVVPPETPDFEVTTELVPIDSDEFLEYVSVESGYRPSEPVSEAVRFRISFKDEADTEDFYAIRLLKYWTKKDQEGAASVYYVSGGFLLKKGNLLSVYETDKPCISSFSDVFSHAGGGRYSDRAFACFNDASFNGREVTKEYMMFHSDSYLYRVQLFRISEEAYRAVETDFLIRSNELAYFGQSTIHPYTNVVGGLGCLGALTMKETEIFALED